VNNDDVCLARCASPRQLVMKSTTKYFSAGSLIAESREPATGLMVITSGSVGLELPPDHGLLDKGQGVNKGGGSGGGGGGGGKTALYVFKRGCFPISVCVCVWVCLGVIGCVHTRARAL
jgi:hypothetical protein